jgi:hypothetical protein
MSPADQLSDRDRAVLAFEREWTGRRGGKAAAIRGRFGFTTARYYQVLAALVASDAAERHDPLLVRRLRRRRRQRQHRALATGPVAQGGRGVTK